MTQELRIDTANIRTLRTLLNGNKEMLASIGQVAQLRVVIDVNFVISDLLQKIKYPSRGRTSLEELMRASVLEVYAPRWLERELPSAFRQVSKKRKLPEADLWSAWQEYQAQIKWDETWDSAPEEFESTDDPKDLPYVNLEKMLGAIGVLSKDGDIARMGGNRLTFDFVFATRDYARAAVVSVGIRVSGIYLGTIGVASLVRVAGLMKASFERISPKWRFVLFVVAVIAVLHPGSRAWLTAQLQKLGPLAKAVFDSVLMLASIEVQKREEAKNHLNNAYAAARLPLAPTDSDSGLAVAQSTKDAADRANSG